MKWLVVMSWLMVCNACWAVYFVTGAALTDVGAAAPVAVDVLDDAVAAACDAVADIVVWSAGRAAAT